MIASRDISHSSSFFSFSLARSARSCHRSLFLLSVYSEAESHLRSLLKVSIRCFELLNETQFHWMITVINLDSLFLALLIRIRRSQNPVVAF